MRMRYENLEVTELIFRYIDFVYELAGRFPKDEMFCLGSQLKRSVNSILMNVAEGTAKKSGPDFARFITIALGSLVETHAGLRIAHRRKYVSDDQWRTATSQIETIWYKLCALRSSQIDRQ